MTVNVRGKVLPLLAASALALGMAACGGNADDTDNGGQTSDLSGELTASGASFPDAFYQVAIEAYADVAPDVVINYNSTGSGTGKKEFGEGLTDFAGTDSLVGEDDPIDAGSFFYIPTVAAPITVSYNLPGVEGLQLGQETLAQIFQGDITTWDDPAIAEANPDADLPGTAITIAHRSDGSGTTSNFTKFLDEATDAWNLGSGDVVEWPSNAQGGEKNTGVASVIEQTEGAIGYVDLADATGSGLVFAAIENADGAYVLPTIAGTTAGLEGADVADDLSYNPLNAAGEAAYPITAPTYLLVKAKYDDAQTAELVKGFVTWLLTDGQALAENEFFAPLPTSLQEQALAQLDKIES
ncbi:phosphate ABC transporter substrate-binding protein (PhoT family) [Stackebrandtia endophytica]|uniref:Phosphate-binding protein n=1 Tax=Stackebrandtia endophytica TaxID=1496996 RepID=A0A543ASC8_9ACTN|nr:phosphate ABC transporter substrate-binding protein PstS [Stackebrandtia endophytica]TQL75489.1 phosphate ABC transporter substrate-binding protein (PhoT family) [Stackebrandtia endophytica]